MQKIFLYLCLVLLLAPLSAGADFSLVDWKYYKDIQAVDTGLNKFVIDDEMFAHTAPDLRDLRVIDNTGRETPHKWVLGRESGGLETYRPKMYNSSFAGGLSSAVFDFGENNQGVNRLEIDTPAANFQSNVTVYGGDDRSGWSVVREKAYIYDYTDSRAGVRSRDTTISFPESLFRYLKIEIESESGSPVRVNGAIGRRYTPARVKESVLTPEITVSEDNRDNTTVVKADLGSGGIPVSRLVLRIDGANFNRGATLYSSFNNTDWRRVAGGYIFRYNTPKFTGENLELDFSESDERYLKLIIHNYDDEPLNVSGLKVFSVYREVLFRAESGRAYRVYYGNDRARLPRYDFEKYFRYLDLDSARAAVLGPEQINSRYEPEATSGPTTPRSERIPYLMPTSLVLAASLLLLLIYRFFKTG